MKFIIGLGNPGKEYEHTRHNAGFLALDVLASQAWLGTPLFAFDKRSNAEIATSLVNDERFLLVKPQTFMNSSGESMRALLDFYKQPPTSLIVLHDDKDIPLGDYKIQTNRGAAGHNGVKSLIAHLGTADFTRIRIGVGPEKPGIEKISDYVLERFTSEERTLLNTTLLRIADDVHRLLRLARTASLLV